MPPIADPTCTTPELSIVVPALNEQDNIGHLVKQVLEQVIEAAGIAAELIVVDDGSTDQTAARLAELAAQHGWLRPLRHPQPMGQSAAMRTGIQSAHGRFIATLDADLQNDPTDLPRMLEALLDDRVDLVQGDRSQNRQDQAIRVVGSWVGRAVRRTLLGDQVRDTGCSIRIMRAPLARKLPLQFSGMHRFIPFYARILGAGIVQVPVNHRPRVAGQTKYGWGIRTRGLSGLCDCLAVRWMHKRYRDPAACPIERRRTS